MKDSFKDAMSCIPCSVSVVSVGTFSNHQTCTISSLVSVDVEDPKILFVLRANSSTLKAISKEELFSVSVLAENQSELAMRYSTSQVIAQVDDWYVGPHQTMSLVGCRISFVCKFQTSFQLGSSTLVISKVMSFQLSKLIEPLVYSDREFKKFSI